MNPNIISVEELREHLNLDRDDSTSLLETKILAAQELIEQFTGLRFADFWQAGTEEGEGEFVAIPAPVLEATRQLAAHLFENRDAITIGERGHTVPWSVGDLLLPYRTWVF